MKVCELLYDILRARCHSSAKCLVHISYLKDESEVSTIWTFYPEEPQEKRCGSVDTAWMVEFELRDMFESFKLVVEFRDACFFDLQSNVFLKNSI